MRLSKEIISKNKLKILLYVLLFVVLLGVSNTKIYYTELTPFGVSLVLALLFIKLNGYILALEFFLSNTILFSDIKMISFTLFVSIAIVILEIIVSSKKFTLKRLYMFLICIIFYIVYIGINFSTGKENIALIVSSILGLLFLYSSLIFFDALINRRLMNKLNIDEKLAGGILLLVFTIGMSCVTFCKVNLGLVFAALISLVSVFVINSNALSIISAIMGFGFSITNFNLIYVSIFLILSIVALAFKCNYKIFSAIAYTGGYVITFVLFDVGVSWFEVLSVLIGSILFVFIPYDILHNISSYFDIKSKVIVNNIINNSKQQIISGVNKLSKVFEEMTDVYKSMVKGNLSDEDALKLLKDELLSSVCSNCTNKDYCYRRSGSFIEHSIDVLLSTGYSKGKVILIDIPSSISSNCIKVNEIVNTSNNLISSYKDYSSAINNLDTSRILIADQLLGVSKLLGNLSSEVDININLDSRFENRIKEDLSYKNIICLECAIYEKDKDSIVVNLIIKKDTLDINVIEKIISKIMSIKMMVESIDDGEISDSVIVNMVVRPNYDIVFGSSVVCKNGKKVSGDNHAIIKIDNGKFMVSICDGMGSGAHANKISSLTIKLIENFYKAGFDNDIILSSVNKLLSLTEEENFSTIDLCIIDCKKNMYDFIKLGATNGYIKRHKREIETISSSNLPVGMLEEISPHITKRLISPFDILVFMSDGVSDAFENKINFENYLYNLDIINPQTLSEEILNKALELNQNIANDDMTVICVRIFDWV